MNGQSWVGLSFGAGWLYFGRYCAADPEAGGRGSYGALRFRLSTGAYELARSGRLLAGWAYAGDGAAFESRYPDVECHRDNDPPQTCTLVRVDGLQFTPIRPLSNG